MKTGYTTEPDCRYFGYDIGDSFSTNDFDSCRAKCALTDACVVVSWENLKSEPQCHMKNGDHVPGCDETGAFWTSGRSCHLTPECSR